MKRYIIAAVATGLLGLGWITLSRSASSRTVTPSFQEVLEAHGGREFITAASTFQAQAVRLTSTQPSSFFERQLRVAVDGARFRRHTLHPLGLREQVELFDGYAGYSATITPAQSGNASPQVSLLNNERLRAVKFSVETFGLLPMLRQCADAATEAVYACRTPGSLDKFHVRTQVGEWNVYADQSHLIRKLEMGDKTFGFADYRAAGGIRLPYVQRLSVGDRLIYELVFSAIDPTPYFATDHFNSETLGRATVQ